MTDRNKDIVLAFLDASRRGDTDTMGELLHPDVKVIEADGLPYGGVSKGPAGFLELIKRVFKTWDNTAVSVDHVMADGDRVVLLASMTGQGKAGGQKFNMPIAEVWLLESGRIKEVRPFYFDTKKLHDIYTESK